MCKRSWCKRNRALPLCFIFLALVFSHCKNTQQWYQSRLRLFVGDKEAEERSLLVAEVSCFKYTVKKLKHS